MQLSCLGLDGCVGGLLSLVRGYAAAAHHDMTGQHRSESASEMSAPLATTAVSSCSALLDLGGLTGERNAELYPRVARALWMRAALADFAALGRNEGAREMGKTR